MLRDASQRAGSMLAQAVACVALTLPIAHAATLAGEPLDAAIRSFETQGLRVFFSSDLVKPWMRVEAEPETGDPVTMLAAILAPHGLQPEIAGDGVVLIVRLPRAAARDAAPASPPPDTVAPAPGRVPKPLEEVIVSTSRYPLERRGTGSAVTLTVDDLGLTPGLGEDTVRPVQRLPGAAANGLSARAHIRGGEVGETLVLFDGLRLFDPFHLKDFQSVFSVVDPRVVSSMDVYTGAFPAAFGDRLSSVIDVDSLNADEPRHHEIGLSFFNASILSAGQVADGRGRWLVSARRSNLDLLYQAFSDQPERPRYLDAFAKFAYEVGPRLTVTANLLGSADDLAFADDVDREERAVAEHDDEYRWVSLDFRLANGGSGRTLFSHAGLASTRSGTSDKAGVSSGSLSDLRSFSISTAQSEWTWPIGDDWLLEFGGQLSWVDGHYDYRDSVSFDLLFDVAGAPTGDARTRELRVDAKGRPASAHISVRRRLTDRLTGDFGLRWDYSALDASPGNAFGPRLGLRFDMSEATQLRFSIGRIQQTQAINELQISDGVASFAPPQLSDHFVVGLQHEFSAGQRLRLELYRKRMDNLRPRFENLLNSRILLPELRPDRVRIDPTSASAEGLELTFASRRGGPVDWWLAYSWSRAEDAFADGPRLRSWDQPHALGAGIDRALGRWDIALAASFRTGWPTTAVTLDAAGELPIISVGARNATRLGDYLSIDLLATRTFELERSALTLSFELSNLFDRRNQCCVEYELGEDEEAGELLLKQLAYLPIVPSVGFRWSF